MAKRIITENSYDSSGVYFKETDLTFATQSIGGFSAASIGMTEKGPAFDIVNSKTFEDRIKKLGDLNPYFPTSFYARQYLEIAKDFKEVRVLGLEGYSHEIGYAISYSVDGGGGENPAQLDEDYNIVTPLSLSPYSLSSVLKVREDIGKKVVDVQVVTVPDENMIMKATDKIFGLKIIYFDGTNDIITCSLRPESPDYIVKKLWDKPFRMSADGVKQYPYIKNNICPVWIDFHIPSTKLKMMPEQELGYGEGDENILLTGSMKFSANDEEVIESFDIKFSIEQNRVKVFVNSDISSWFNFSTKVIIKNVTGTGDSNRLNGTFDVDTVEYGAAPEGFEFENCTSFYLTKNGVYVNASEIELTYPAVTLARPNWKKEVLDFSGIEYQTPTTPWFISDFDSDGDYKKLFRLWSISDGESANSEIKIEIANINPAGNNGSGSFDILVRKFDDRDDLTKVIFEKFTNLTLNPESENYIVKRIGDGENNSLRSSYILVQINEDEPIDSKALPYGVLGYSNITGNLFFPLPFTTEYDYSKPISKQTLGLANNKINAFATYSPYHFKFLNNQTGARNFAFHLNPNDRNIVENEFEFSKHGSVFTSDLTHAERVARSKFVVCFQGGFDGFDVTKEREWNKIGSPDYKALQKALERLSDPENINSDFTVLVTPDFQLNDITGSAAVEETLSMVTKRGDCLYIPDLPYSYDSDPSAAAEVVNFSEIKSSSCAIYHPWVQINNPINKSNVWLPPSILALGTIAYVAQNEQVWQPPGGSLRTVTNNLIRTRRRMKITDREILKLANINPITIFPGSGYEITEVRTTQEEFSALSFIHNRLLLCYAKKILNQTLRPLLFQLNGQISTNAFLTTVSPIFNRIKKLNGIEEYKVEVVERPELMDRTTLYGKITIVPLYPIEKIIIDFTLVDTGVSYDV